MPVRVVFVTRDARVHGWRVLGGIARKCLLMGSRGVHRLMHVTTTLKVAGVIPTSNARDRLAVAVSLGEWVA